jgi:DHA1 family quinolone resistance protein-like MFS transporter
MVSDSDNLKLVRWLTCLMFFTFAMTTDAVGSVIPEVIREFALSLTTAGSFQYSTMAGIAAGALLLGFLADRVGRRLTIILGLSLYSLSCLLFAVSHSFWAFVALLAAGGLGISVFKTGALALIGDISATTSSHTRLMNLVEGFFAVGAIVGPAVVATLITSGLSWKWLYIIAASICIVLIVIAARIRYPQVKRLERSTTVKEIAEVFSDPLALGFSLLIMLYVATEVAIYVWMPTYLADYAGGVEWLPAYALTIFFVLVISSLAIFLCFLASVTWGVKHAAWLLPLSGLFMSIIYPTLNSKGISCFPKARHGAAAGVILFFTAIAAVLGPLAMAAVSDAYESRHAGFALATGFSLLLLAGVVVNLIFDPARGRLQKSDATSE